MTLPSSEAETRRVPKAEPPRRFGGLGQGLLGLALVAGLVASTVWEGGGVVIDQAEVAGELVNVSSATGGRLATLLVAEGQALEKGQPLARLEDGAERAQLARAEANLAVAVAEQRAAERSADWRGAQTGAAVGQAEAARAIAAAEARAAEARLDLAKSRLEIFSAASERDLVSDQDVEAAALEAKTANEGLAAARARERSAREALGLARAGTRTGDTAPGGVASAIARVRLAEADRALAKWQLQEKVVRAPGAGVLARRLVHAGEHLAAGQAIASVLLTDRVWVRAYLREAELGRVREAAPATVFVDALPGRSFAGRVAEIGAIAGIPSPAPGLTFLDRRVPVRVTIDAPPGTLRPGLTARVRLESR